MLNAERETGNSTMLPSKFIQTAIYKREMVALKQRPRLKKFVGNVSKKELVMLKVKMVTGFAKLDANTGSTTCRIT